MIHKQSADDAPQYRRLKQHLITGIESLGIGVSEQQLDQLLSYLKLFSKWNAAYNLSAVRNIEEMVSRHLLDSLSIAPFIQDGERWLDVGSGGGLPGIPLAILFPERHITLLDSNGKKTRFLFQAKTELQLDSLSVVQSRVESYQPTQTFDLVFSRAFASIGELLTSCAHLVTDGGHFFAMKGQYPEEELRDVKKPFTVEHCSPLQVPGETAARHLVVIRRDDKPTPKAAS